MKRRVFYLLSTSLIYLLTACTSFSHTQQATFSETVTPQPPAINYHLFGMNENDIEPHDTSIFELSDEQATAFLQIYHNNLGNLPEHLRLSEYLTNLVTGYNYLEKTLPATETFDGTAGNCMSLVILTTALANLVGLDIDYQRLTTRPIFDRNNDLILVSDHVRTRVFRPQSSREDNRLTILRAHVVIDYFPSRESRRAERIDQATLLAMYYTNLAAESLIEDNIKDALRYSGQALSHVPSHAGAANILAVLHNRYGDIEQAEAFYQYGLEYAPNEVNLLSNYKTFLHAQGRISEASIIEQRLVSLNDINPFQLIALAERAEENGFYETALKYYRSAREVAPYLHEIYLREASLHEALGDLIFARNILIEGFEESKLAGTQQQYKYRLQSIKASSMRD